MRPGKIAIRDKAPRTAPGRIKITGRPRRSRIEDLAVWREEHHQVKVHAELREVTPRPLPTWNTWGTVLPPKVPSMEPETTRTSPFASTVVVEVPNARRSWRKAVQAFTKGL